jgi:outer membrane protein OmpA-like peptidoglycan-associated protein
MNLKRTLALAALLSSAASVAHATEGWYGRADVGYSVDGETEFDSGTAYDLDDEWMGALGAGYALGNGLRLEGELSHRDNPASIGGVSANFDVRTLSLMANVFYDFNRGGRFEPYIGVGIGAIDPEFNDSPPEVEVDPGFAWQALVGVAIGLTPQLDLDIGYRYLQADDLDADEGGFPAGMEYMHQAVTVGLRYQFAAAAAPAAAAPAPAPAAPPPPAPPPPVACPQSEFVVYFEWDRSSLNQSALETIDAAVARARQCNIANIVVVGHTDTSGSPQYNMALSERRAGVVREALVARGIPDSAITAQARGETELAQQTRDGVREPLNRRTAVTISFR